MGKFISSVEVEDVSKALVEVNGDVEACYKQVHDKHPNISKELITRIRNKQYMKFVSDKYFKVGQFGSIKKDDVDLTKFKSGIIDISAAPVIEAPAANNKPKGEEKMEEKEAPKKKGTSRKHAKRLTHEQAELVCQLLVKHNFNQKKVAKQSGVAEKTVHNIKTKVCFVEISDKYFNEKLEVVGEATIVSTPVVAEPVSVTTPVVGKPVSEPVAYVFADKTPTPAPTVDIGNMTMEDIKKAAEKGFMKKPISDVYDKLPENIRNEVDIIFKKELDNMSFADILKLIS